MKKLTLWWLFTGSLCMSIGLLVSPFIKIPVPVIDFLKEFGIVLIIAALFVQRKLQRVKR